MKLLLLLLLIPSVVFGASVSLQWDANSEVDLAGYKVYFSNYSGNTSVFPALKPGAIASGATTHTITGLDSTKKWFFRVTAFNIHGQESMFSNVVNVNFIQPPKKARFIQVDIR